MKRDWFLTSLVAIVPALIVGASAYFKVDRINQEKDALRSKLEASTEREHRLIGLLYPRSLDCYPAKLTWGNGQCIEIPRAPWMPSGQFVLSNARFGMAADSPVFVPMPDRSLASSTQVSGCVFGPYPIIDGE